MLSDRLEKVNAWCDDHKSDLFIAALVCLVGLGSFGLGRLSVIWPAKDPITIENQELRVKNQGREQTTGNSSSTDSKVIPPASSGRYVASKSGTAYHYPWCPGASQIKEANKIWFQTKAEAEARGYKPAANCSGL